MAQYPIKMLKDESGAPFIPLVAPEGVIDTNNKNLTQMLNGKINEPAADGTAGQVLTTDGSGGRTWATVQQDIFRYSTMPTPSSTLVGQIVQYIGTTTASYQNGSFYECTTSPSTANAYVWTKITDTGCIYTTRTATSAILVIFTPGDTDSSWSNSSAMGAAIGHINKAKTDGVTQLDITVYKVGDAYNTSCSFLVSRFRINPQANEEINTSTDDGILVSYNAHGSYSTNYAVLERCTSTLKIWYDSTTEKYFRMALNFNGILNSSHAYLAKDNTVSYTPTGDYNPATKKYVDDNIGGKALIDVTSTSSIEIANSITKISYNSVRETVGNKFTNYDGGVKIGAGVSKVRVTICQAIQNSAAGSAPDQKRIELFINSTSVRQFYALAAATQYASTTISATAILSVQEDDVLYVKGARGSIASGSLTGDYSTFIVEFVE